MSERRLFGFLGERALDLEGLDGPVRRVIFTTIAVLLALALATAVRGLMGGRPYVADPGVPIMPAVAWIAAGGAALAFVFLLTGAAHARNRWRYLLITPVLLAVFAAIAATPVGIVRQSVATWWLGGGLPLLALAGCVAVVALGPRLKLRTLLMLTAGIVCLYLVGAIALTAKIWPSYGATALFIVMGVAALALEPALMVVGADIAEIGAAATAAILARAPEGFGTGRRRLRVGLMAAALALLVGFRLWLGDVPAKGWWLFGLWIAGALLGMAAIAAVVLIRRAPVFEHKHMRFRTLLLTAIALYVAAMTALSFNVPAPDRFNYDVAHTFSLKLPAKMRETFRYPPDAQARRRGDLAVHFLTGGKGLPSLAIYGAVRPPFAPPHDPTTINEANDMRAGILSQMPLGLSKPDAAGWRHGTGRGLSKGGHAFHFLVLEREEPTPDAITDMDWFIVCGDAEAKAAATDALCANVAQNFRSDIKDESSRPASAVIDAMLWVGALGLLAFAVWRGRRKDSAVLDFVILAVWLTAMRGMAGYLFGGADEVYFDTRILSALFCAVLAASLLVAAALELEPVRRTAAFDIEAARRLAGGAVAGLVAVGVVFFLYVFASDRSDDSQAFRAVVVCLALAWELITAGPMLNLSPSHRAFARSSRVLIFVGYLIAVATCVFMFGRTDFVYGGIVMGAYDTEGVVASGIVILGSALIFSQIARTLPALRPSRPAPPRSTKPSRRPPHQGDQRVG